MRSRVLGLLCAALGYLTLAHAGAEPTADERERASRLFREGRDLLSSGDVATACARLAESQRLDPAGGTLLNLALCEERADHTATAYRLFGEALEVAERDGHPERVEEASLKRRQLLPRLPWLRIRTSAAARGAPLRVELDGRVLSAAELDVDLPIDPGVHAVSASAAAHRAWRDELHVPMTGGRLTVVVPALVPLDEARPRGTAPTATRSAVLWPAWLSSGVAFAGVGIGSWYGLRAIQREHDFEGLCPVPADCTRAGADLHDQAGRAADVSSVAFVVGAAALVAATWLFLDPPQRESTSARRRATGVVRW